MTFDKAYPVIIEFISKYSIEQLINLLKHFTERRDSESDMYYNIISGVVAAEFGVSIDHVMNSGNNRAIYRNLCYHLHRESDPKYSIKRMTRLYKKQENSVRLGLVNIDNIIENPKISKAYYIKIIGAKLRLNTILEWQSQSTSEQKTE